MPQSTALQKAHRNSRLPRNTWASLDADKDGGITARSLYWEAENHGWRDPIADAELKEEFGPLPTKTTAIKNPLRALNKSHAVTTLGGKTAIMTIDRDSVSFGNVGDFKLKYLNEPFKDKKAEIAALAGGAAPSKMTIADAWLPWKHRRQFPAGVEFRPNGDVSVGAYNLWRGWKVEGDAAESCDLFLAHVFEVICNSNRAHYDWLLGWLAHMIQKPGQKPRSAIVLRGEKGAGKDIVAAYVARLMHRTAYLNTSDQDAVWGQFNGAIANKLLLHLEEAFFSGDHKADSRIKNLITAETQTINEKHAPVFTVDSFHRLWITSNELRVVNSTAGERRYFISEVSDHRCGDKAYFDALVAEMNGSGPAALMHHLRSYDLSKWDSRPPATEALIEAISENLTGVTAWMRDCIEDRRIVGDSAGFDWPEDWERTERFRVAFDEWAKKPSNRFRGGNVTGSAFGKQISPFLERPRKLVGPRDAREYHYLLKEWDAARDSMNSILTKGNQL